MSYERLRRKLCGVDCLHTSELHKYDWESFFLPELRTHHGHLHGKGVVRGLEVATAQGGAKLEVSPGLAVDGYGELIILSDDGQGCAEIENILDKNGPPYQLDASKKKGQSVYVTIEKYDDFKDGGSQDVCGYTERIAHLRLQEAITDLQKCIVLAWARIDVNGIVQELTVGDDPHWRHMLSQQLGALEIHRSNSVNSSVAEEAAGSIEPIEPANGNGLRILGDNLDIGKSGAPASLTVFGQAEVIDTLHVAKAATLDQALSVGGNLDIGKSDAPANLTVFGQAEVIDTLHVAKAATLDQALSVGGNLDIGKSDAPANLTVFGQAEVIDTLHVAKAATLDQALSVGGNLDVGKSDAPANLTVSGKAEVMDTLHVVKAAALDQALSVGGNVGIGTANPDARLTIQTPDPYTGETLRFEAKKEPKVYSLTLNTVVTDGVVRWVFNQCNANIDTPAVLAFDRGNVGIGTTAPGANARLAVVGGGITVGSTPWVGDAAIQVTSSFGGMDRLLQLSPTGASKPGLNLVASTDSSSNEQWWVWGVTAGNKFRIQPGTAFAGDAGLTIGPNSNVGIGTTGPKNTLDVKGAAVIGASYAGSNAAPANGLLVEGNVGIGKSGAPANLAVSGKAEVSDTLQVGKAVTLDQALIVGTNLTVKGKINNRTIAADGDNLDRHLANTGNPHAVTPELIGALSVSGGWISGGLGVGSDLLVSGTISSTKALLPDQEIGHASHALLNEWSVALRPSQAKLLFYNYEDSAKGNWAGIGVSSDGRIWIRAGWNNNLNDDAARTLVLIGPDIVISSRNWDHK